MSRTTAALTAAFALYPAVSTAQSLDAFLDAARAHGLKRAAARATLAGREAEASATRATLGPALTARGGYTRNQYEAAAVRLGAPGTTPERAIITAQDQWDGSVRLDMPLVDPARWVRVGAAGHPVEAAAARVDEATDTEARAVVSWFFELLGQNALVSAAQKDVETAQQSASRQQRLFEAGRSTALDLQRANAEIVRREQSRADAVHATNLARRRLEVLSGLAPSSLVAPASEDIAVDVATVSAGALPSVRAAKADADAAESLSRQARAALAPSLQAFGQERWTNATGFLGKNAQWSAGVELLWKGDAGTLAALRALEAQADAARIRASEVERDARERVLDDARDITFLVQSVAASKAEEATLALAARSARERFDAGALGQVDLLQAERDLTDAAARRIRSEAQLGAAREYLRLDAGLAASEAR
jgi:outer membrane protein TolC